MIKLLSRSELKKVEVPNFQAMTRRDKLLRWAKLVREAPGYLCLYSNLEHFTKKQLAGIYVKESSTAFGLAVADPLFKGAGLRSNASVADCMDFFEVTQKQLHEFSCDCGGRITNKEMSYRIQELA